MKKFIIYILLALMPLSFMTPSFAADRDNDSSTHNGPDGPDDTDDNNDEPDDCAPPGSPVLLHKMTFLWSDTDVSLKGRTPISIKRTFNSFDPTPGIFGKGWHERCERKLFKSLDHDDQSGIDTIIYVYKQPGGRTSEFLEQADGSFASPDSMLQVALSESAAGLPRLTNLDGSYTEFDLLGFLTAEADRNGNFTHYDYINGALVKIYDDHGRFLDLAYNASGFVETVTDHSGRQWFYSYNGDATLASVTDPMGGVYSYEYESFTPLHSSNTYALLNKVIDQTGVTVVEVTYDNNGKVVSYTEGENLFTYSQQADHILKTDSMGSTRRYWLNDDGKFVREQLFNGGFIEREFDDKGRFVRETDPEGLVIKITYDELGRLSSQERTANDVSLGQTIYEYEDSKPWPVKIISPEGNETLYSFDNRGNVVSYTDPANVTTSFLWDSEGDLISKTDALGRETLFETNDLGLITSKRDPLGRVTDFTYSEVGKLISRTNAKGELVQHAYDQLDRISRIVEPLGAVTTFNYDLSNRLLSVVVNNGSMESYIYDSYGRVETKKPYNNEIERYTYRVDNLVETITLANGSISRYGYDDGKRRVQQDHADGIINYTYNLRDQLESGDNGVHVSYDYDGYGRLISESFNGQIANITLDSDDHVMTLNGVGQALVYTRDGGEIESIQSSEGTYQLNRDALGRLSGLSRPNARFTQNTFDTAYQLTGIDHQSLNDGQYLYEYDEAGRIESWTGDEQPKAYTYDGNGRLLTANFGPALEQFEYDELGNRTDSGAIYNQANQLLDDNDWVYNYDLEGNMTDKVSMVSSERHKYTYNNLNQLVGYEYHSDADEFPEVNASYIYGPFGRRASKTVSGTLTQFYWVGPTMVREKIGLEEYDYHWMGVDFPLAQTSSEGTAFYHNDHLGMPQLMTDEAGDVVWTAQHSAYGEIESETGTRHNPWRFPGQYFDEESGLHYNYYRDYDPSLGRYLQLDPIGLLGGLNTYGYALQNPVMYTDPTGEVVPVAEIVIVGGVCLGLYCVDRAVENCRAANPNREDVQENNDFLGCISSQVGACIGGIGSLIDPIQEAVNQSASSLVD